MANTKISALTALTNPTWSEEFVYAYNNANWKVTLNTMKSFIWEWGTVTELTADANIWELAGGTYLTAYNLFYKTWEKVPTNQVTWATREQMLFVTEETNGDKAFLVFSVWHTSTVTNSYASFWWSKSSSEWEVFRLSSRDWALRQYGIYVNSLQSGINSFAADSLTQIIDWISGTDYLTVSTGSSPFPWVTYTVYISSVASGQNYTIDLWTWVTNPLNIALPTSSTKKCVITCLITSTTTAIVTGCTIEA
jgi:hypothetical protein